MLQVGLLRVFALLVVCLVADSEAFCFDVSRARENVEPYCEYLGERLEFGESRKFQSQCVIVECTRYSMSGCGYGRAAGVVHLPRYCKQIPSAEDPCIMEVQCNPPFRRPPKPQWVRLSNLTTTKPRPHHPPGGESGNYEIGSQDL